MKKSEVAEVYGIIRRMDVKNIESGVRAKMLANTITGKKVAREIEEAYQVVKDGLTDEEKKAMETLQILREKMAKDRNYMPSDEEKKAADVVKEWNKTYQEAMEKELNTEVVIDWNKLTKDELMKLADGNSMTLDEMALLQVALV